MVHRLYQKIVQTDTKKLERNSILFVRIASICMGTAIMLGTVSPAFAWDGPPDLTPMMGMFTSLAEMFISLAYGLMVILFAVGTVKSGLSAQMAQQFGAANRVGNEFLNLAGGAAIFVFGLMSLPIVRWVIKELASQIPQDQMNLDDLPLIPGN